MKVHPAVTLVTESRSRRMRKQEHDSKFLASQFHRLTEPVQTAVIASVLALPTGETTVARPSLGRKSLVPLTIASFIERQCAGDDTRLVSAVTDDAMRNVPIWICCPSQMAQRVTGLITRMTGSRRSSARAGLSPKEKRSKCSHPGVVKKERQSPRQRKDAVDGCQRRLVMS